MTETPTLLDNVSQTFRDHGLTAAITALMGGSLAVAATVTRKAFTNEAMLERLEHELAAERGGGTEVDALEIAARDHDRLIRHTDGDGRDYRSRHKCGEL